MNLSSEGYVKPIIIDILTINQDRHFGNFRFTINNKTREIIGFMLLFDHGYSLGNFILNHDDVENKLMEQGTFSNTRLIDQGKELYKEKLLKK